MNSEYILDKEQIKRINEKHGGTLRSDAEIETALMLGKGRAIYKKIAYLWRAILVSHPFTDGNKRTALAVAIAMLEKCGIEIKDVSMEKMVEEIIKIARENMEDITNIERLIRYAVEGN